MLFRSSGDITNTGTATGCTFTPSAATGSTFTVTASGCAGGTVIPQFAVNGASDPAGNTGPVSAANGTTITVVTNVGLATDRSRQFTGTPSAVGLLDQNALDLSNFTFEAWVKPTASTGEMHLLNKEYAYEVAIINGVVQYALANTTAGNWAWVSTGIKIGRAHV